MAFDPELNALLAEGDNADTWRPMMDKPKIPTYEGIKVIRKYFPQYSGIPYNPHEHVYPAYFYHPDGRTIVIRDQMTAEDPPQIAKSAKKVAKELGIEYVKSSHDERARGFAEYHWSYDEGCEWRAMPFEKHLKFDPSKVQHSKTVVYPQHQQGGGGVSAEQIAAIVSAVSVQFEDRARRDGKAALEADPQWAEFQAFTEWRRSQAAQEANPKVKEVSDILDQEVAELSELANAGEDELKSGLIAEAERRGIKIDKRWGLQKLRDAIEKAVAA